MEENSVDLVVTSPPYNVGIPYDIYDDTLPWAEYYRWCASWLTEVHRVLKPDGRLCLNHYFSLGSGKCRTAPLMVLNGIAQEVGLSHKSVAIWYDSHRPKCTAWGSWLSASAPYITSPAEGILFLYKDTWKKQRPGKSTIEKEEFLEAIRGSGRSGRNLSPGQKPTSLWRSHSGASVSSPTKGTWCSTRSWGPEPPPSLPSWSGGTTWGLSYRQPIALSPRPGWLKLPPYDHSRRLRRQIPL